MSSSRLGDLSQWSTSSMSWTTSRAGMAYSQGWGCSCRGAGAGAPAVARSCLRNVLRGDFGDPLRRWGWRLRGVDAMHLRDHVVPEVPLVVAGRVLQHAAEVSGQLVGVDA